MRACPECGCYSPRMYKEVNRRKYSIECPRCGFAIKPVYFLWRARRRWNKLFDKIMKIKRMKLCLKYRTELYKMDWRTK